MTGDRVFPDAAADREADEAVDRPGDRQPVLQPRGGSVSAQQERADGGQLAVGGRDQQLVEQGDAQRAQRVADFPQLAQLLLAPRAGEGRAIADQYLGVIRAACIAASCPASG